MKRLTLILLFTAATQVVSFAQAQVALGIKGGANIAKFDVSDAESLVSPHAGAFALFKLTKLGIQPEVLFSQQGAKLNDIDLGEVDFKTSYLTIPVMLKIYLLAGLNLQLGPQFGFLTAASFNGDDVKESLKNSDITGNFGLGWDLPFGLTIDARYNLGFSDVNDGFSTESLKSRVIQISLGYKILKLGK
jgi:hypothetical protein